MEWSAVHEMVCTNVNRFFSELMGYKAKLIEMSGTDSRIMRNTSPNSLIKLRDLYFFDEGCYQALLNLVADKYLRAIVNMIYKVLACHLLAEVPPLNTLSNNKQESCKSP